MNEGKEEGIIESVDSICRIAQTHNIIGASLSEPHTSVTSLHLCVCMFARLLACLDRPLTVNHFWPLFCLVYVIC